MSLFTMMWVWEPSVLIGGLALLVGYGWLVDFHLRAVAGWFIVGVGLLVWSLVGPLDLLGDTYLFSAHMLQHLIMILIVPPCLLLGLPQPAVHALLRRPVIRRVERVLGQPGLAWLLQFVTIWLWHLPVLYEAALRHGGLHVVQHLTFLVTAVIFWWPLVAPAGPLRRSPVIALIYLFGAAASSSILGIILTFAGPGLYPSYLYPRDPLHILALLRATWGISAALDQQIGGLLMWVPGGLIYLLAMMGALARWYSEPVMTARSPAVKREGVSDAA